MLHDEIRRWTAVRNCVGLFQYTRLAQVLVNSGATFQRVVKGILGNMREIDEKAYIDDLRIDSEDTEKNIAAVEELLQRLLKDGMRAKWSKCSLGRKEV